MRSILILLGFAALSQAQWYDNNPPVPGRRPQFKNGTSTQGIDIEVVYDLMCSDTAALAPAFAQFLASTWNVTNTAVSDAVQVTYTFLPLPYHHEVWIPHLLLPYFLDNCQFGPNKCQFFDYLNYCLTNQDAILGAKDLSANTIVLQWTNQVAQALNLPQADLLACFNPAYDKHNSESRTRIMYKYNAHHHVTGTPFAFVNGVLLENFPETAAEWTNVLFGVYQAQYQPPKQQDL